MTRVLAIGCALLAITGCSAFQVNKCVRDTVRANEPYQTQADRDDSETLARQLCRQRVSGKAD